MNYGVIQTEWARALLALLVDLGVTDFVVSPGSRSTPLVLGLGQLPEDQIRVHSVIDERSAGFFALGLARSTGRAPALICTSGTAPAHYYPAIIEASESGHPMVVISADRPLALQGLRAPQTIEQLGLFGQFVVASVDLGQPSEDDASCRSMLRRTLGGWKLLKQQARPLHLNVRFDKPLEASRAELDASSSVREQWTARLARTPRYVALDPSAKSAAQDLLDSLCRAERPLFVLGELEPSDAVSVLKLASAFGGRAIPTVGECASQAPGVADLDLALRVGGLDALRPDLVIQWGGNVCSGKYLEWLERAGPSLAIVSSSVQSDPACRASYAVQAHVGLVADACLGLGTDNCHPRERSKAKVDLEYGQRFEELRKTIAHQVRAALGKQACNLQAAWPEANAVATLLGALPENTKLFVGNSLPLRLVNWTLGAARGERPLKRVLVQRGVNGIDGLIAGGLGLAGAPTEGPVVLLLGDVSAVHDLGALALTKLARQKLLIFVLDNRGGHIFDHLPIGRSHPPNYSLWTTEPEVDFCAVARGYGVHSQVMESDVDLTERIASLLAHPAQVGLCVLRVTANTTPQFLAEIQSLRAET